MRLALVTATLSCALAQAPSEPPTLLRLIRDASASNPASRAPITTIAMSAITGAPETWTMEFHDAFASIEDADRAAGKHSSNTGHTTIVLYQPELSYRPDQALRDLAKARYVNATWYEFQTGQDWDFHEMVRLRRAAYERINYDRPELAYLAISGTSSSTYVFLAPLLSLKVLDNGTATVPAYAEALTEGQNTTARQIAARIGLTRARILLRVEPTLSSVGDDFASADPEFWTGRARQ